MSHCTQNEKNVSVNLLQNPGAVDMIKTQVKEAYSSRPNIISPMIEGTALQMIMFQMFMSRISHTLALTFKHQAMYLIIM